MNTQTKVEGRGGRFLIPRGVFDKTQLALSLESFRLHAEDKRPRHFLAGELGIVILCLERIDLGLEALGKGIHNQLQPSGRSVRRQEIPEEGISRNMRMRRSPGRASIAKPS